MTDKERIEEVRFFFKKNKTEFSKILGYATPQSYTNYLRGANNLSMKMVKALKEHDSRVSIDWLLEGQGEMLLDNQKKIYGDGNNTQIGDFNNSENSNNKNISVNSNNNEVILLKKEIEHLKQRLEDKEELVTILKKNQK